MSKTDTLEVDQEVAEVVKARAADRGMTISELLAEWLNLDTQPIALQPGEIAELDRRWKAVEDGRATVSNTEVVRWLRFHARETRE